MERASKDQPKKITPEERYKCEYRREKITEMIDTIDSIIDSSPDAKPMKVVCVTKDSIVDDCRRDTSTFFKDTHLALKKAVSITKDIDVDGKKVHAEATFGIPEWNKDWKSVNMNSDMDFRYFSIKLSGGDREHYFIVGENKEKDAGSLSSYWATVIQRGRSAWAIFADSVFNTEPLLDLIKQFKQ